VTDDTLFSSRALPPGTTRFIAADTPVSSLEDIHRAINRASAFKQPLSLRLAADIMMSSGITIPANIPRFQLTGGNTWRLRFTAPIAFVFNVASQVTDVLLHDFEALSVDGALTASVFLTTSDTVGSRVKLRGLSIRDTTDLVDPARQWSVLSAIGCRLQDTGGVSFMNVRDTSGGGIVACRFSQCVGSFVVTLANANSGLNSFIDCGATQTFTSSVDTSASTGQNVFAGCFFYGYAISPTDTLSPGRLDLNSSAHMSILGAYCPRPWPQTVNAAAVALQTVSGLLRLTLGSSASGSMSIPDGAFPGQMLVIESTSSAGSASIANSTSNNVRLTRDWVPQAFDVLSLFWDAVDGNWVEQTRSNAGAARNYTGTVSTTDATPTAAVTIPTTSPKSYALILTVIGRQTNSTNQSGTYTIHYKVKNVAGALTISTATVIARQEDQATWGDPDVIASGSSIVVRVTGAAAMNVSWLVDVSVQESP
jgi:hypothetical protein